MKVYVTTDSRDGYAGEGYFVEGESWLEVIRQVPCDARTLTRIDRGEVEAEQE